MTQEMFVTLADFLRLKQMIRHARRRTRPGTYLHALERELRRATIVPVEGIPRDTVTMNSQVRIRDAEAQVRETITVVYPHHSDPDQGHVPVVAPLGTALLGQRVGDVVRWRGPRGSEAWEIETVLYQPEAVGDHHL